MVSPRLHADRNELISHAGQLVRRIDLYELNPDNMNRLTVDPISRGVIVTDGGNKKIWAIGPEGEKKAIQYRPWRKCSNDRAACSPLFLR